jgi:hypothetical protein
MGAAPSNETQALNPVEEGNLDNALNLAGGRMGDELTAEVLTAAYSKIDDEGQKHFAHKLKAKTEVKAGWASEQLTVTHEQENKLEEDTPERLEELRHWSTKAMFKITLSADAKKDATKKRTKWESDVGMKVGRGETLVTSSALVVDDIGLYMEVEQKAAPDPEKVAAAEKAAEEAAAKKAAAEKKDTEITPEGEDPKVADSETVLAAKEVAVVNEEVKLCKRLIHTSLRSAARDLNSVFPVQMQAKQFRRFNLARTEDDQDQLGVLVCTLHVVSHYDLQYANKDENDSYLSLYMEKPGKEAMTLLTDAFGETTDPYPDLDTIASGGWPTLQNAQRLSSDDYEEIEILLLTQYVMWLRQIDYFMAQIGGSAGAKSVIHALVHRLFVKHNESDCNKETDMHSMFYVKFLQECGTMSDKNAAVHLLEQKNGEKVDLMHNTGEIMRVLMRDITPDGGAENGKSRSLVLHAVTFIQDLVPRKVWKPAPMRAIPCEVFDTQKGEAQDKDGDEILVHGQVQQMRLLADRIEILKETSMEHMHHMLQDDWALPKELIPLSQVERCEISLVLNKKAGRLPMTVYVHGNKSQGKRIWMLRMGEKDFTEFCDVLKGHLMTKHDEVIAGYMGANIDHPAIEGCFWRHGEYGVQIWAKPADTPASLSGALQKYDGGWRKHYYHLNGALYLLPQNARDPEDYAKNGEVIVYEGLWSNGVRHGRGTVFGTGWRFTGMFYNDEACGWGELSVDAADGKSSYTYAGNMTGATETDPHAKQALQAALNCTTMTGFDMYCVCLQMAIFNDSGGPPGENDVNQLKCLDPGELYQKTQAAWQDIVKFDEGAKRAYDKVWASGLLKSNIETDGVKLQLEKSQAFIVRVVWEALLTHQAFMGFSSLFHYDASKNSWTSTYYRTAEERASKWMDLDEYKKQCETLKMAMKLATAGAQKWKDSGPSDRNSWRILANRFNALSNADVNNRVTHEIGVTAFPQFQAGTAEDKKRDQEMQDDGAFLSLDANVGLGDLPKEAAKELLEKQYAGCPFDNKDIKFHNFDKCELNEHIEGNKPVETIKKKFIQGPLAYGGVYLWDQKEATENPELDQHSAFVHEKGVPKFGIIGNLDFGKDPALGETKDAGGRAKNKSLGEKVKKDGVLSYTFSGCLYHGEPVTSPCSIRVFNNKQGEKGLVKDHICTFSGDFISAGAGGPVSGRTGEGTMEVPMEHLKEVGYTSYKGTWKDGGMKQGTLNCNWDKKEKVEGLPIAWTYTGEFGVDGREGKGKIELVWTDQSKFVQACVFDGEWENDNPKFGEMIWYQVDAEGKKTEVIKYEGGYNKETGYFETKHGKPAKFHRLLEDCHYQGPFKEGMFHGVKGNWEVLKDGFHYKYKGSHEKGQRHGKGAFVFDDSKRPESQGLVKAAGCCFTGGGSESQYKIRRRGCIYDCRKPTNLSGRMLEGKWESDKPQAPESMFVIGMKYKNEYGDIFRNLRFNKEGMIKGGKARLRSEGYRALYRSAFCWGCCGTFGIGVYAVLNCGWEPPGKTPTRLNCCQAYRLMAVHEPYDCQASGLPPAKTLLTVEKVDAKPTGNTEMETIHGLPDHPYEIPKDDPAAAMSKVLSKHDPVIPLESWMQTYAIAAQQPAAVIKAKEEMHEGLFG